MIGWLLKLLLLFVLIRAVMLVVGGLIRGVLGQAAAAPGRSQGPSRGPVSVSDGTLVQDPVCGTYVVKDRALVMNGADGPVYFCSAACRSAYDPQVARAR